MKILMVTDMEGVAGVVSFVDQSYPDGRYYDAGKRLVTGEVNAAVDGLLDAGVEEVLVWDGHGVGGIDYESLHPQALLLHGRPSPPWSRVQEVIRRYDAFVIVGQHAMAGVVTSNQNHTQSSHTVDAYRLNGKLIGEIGQLALFMGGLGLPLLFLSGERDACREAEELAPAITTVAVKEGLGRGSAISLSAQAARQRIRQGSAAAVAQHRRESDCAPGLARPLSAGETLLPHRQGRCRDEQSGRRTGGRAERSLPQRRYSRYCLPVKGSGQWLVASG